MDSRDHELLSRVKSGLFTAQDRLVQANNGRAIWESGDPQPADRLNARLTIGKDMIRENTGRSKVRDVLISQYADELSKDRSLSVSRMGNNIIVETKADIEDGNFTSLDDLEKFISKPVEDEGNE